MDNVEFLESDVTTWSEADHERLLAELSPIFNAPASTPEAARCDVLCDLIWKYEEIHYPMPESASATRDLVTAG